MNNGTHVESQKKHATDTRERRYMYLFAAVGGVVFSMLNQREMGIVAATMVTCGVLAKHRFRRLDPDYDAYVAESNAKDRADLRGVKIWLVSFGLCAFTFVSVFLVTAGTQFIGPRSTEDPVTVAFDCTAF